MDPIGPKDKCKDKNTCGITVQELFERYSLYDPQRGLYRSWGDIIFPWDIDVSVRSNLNYSLTDDKWKIAKYAAVYAYFEGDRVLYIEDDGYKICLYEANQDVLAIAGPLDKTKWDQICCIELSEPFGLPTLEELEERCHYYNLEFFWKKWKNYSGEWEDNLFEQAINTCNTAGVSTAEFIERLKEKESEYECTSDKSSDRWKEARIRKGNFYERGDCILVKGVCEDTVCVFLAHTNMPATDENYKKYKKYDNLVQDHHIIPKQWKKHKLIKNINFDINSSNNLIIMPTQKTFLYFNLDPNIRTHYIGHPKYNIYVKETLPKKNNERFITDSICFNVCRLAQRVEAKAIITMTHSGYTAYKISSQRPKSEIFVFSSNKKLLSTLSLVWGVSTFYYNKTISTDHTIADITHLLKAEGYAESGDLIINTASIPLLENGKTNMLKLSYID